MSGDVVKQGYIKVKSKHLGTWNKRWFKLRDSSDGKPKRLEKYQDETLAKHGSSERTIYPLEGIKYVDLMPEAKKKNCIQLVFEDYNSIQLLLDSELETENWLSAIQQLVYGQGKTSKKDVFEVYVMKSSALNASGECLLQVTADSICLLDIENPQRVQLSWPLKSIRKYSTERGMFRIETGRSSPTGEGHFLFDSKYSDEIFERVRAATKALTSKTSTEGQQNTTNLDAERKYHASMTAHKTNPIDEPPPYTAPSASKLQKSCQTRSGSHSSSNTPDYFKPCDEDDDQYYTSNSEMYGDQQPKPGGSRMSTSQSNGKTKSQKQTTQRQYDLEQPINEFHAKSKKTESYDEVVIPKNQFRSDAMSSSATPTRGNVFGASGSSTWQQDEEEEYYGMVPSNEVPPKLPPKAKQTRVSSQRSNSAAVSANVCMRDLDDDDGVYYASGSNQPKSTKAASGQQSASSRSGSKSSFAAAHHTAYEERLTSALQSALSDGIDLHHSRVVDKIELR